MKTSGVTGRRDRAIIAVTTFICIGAVVALNSRALLSAENVLAAPTPKKL
jgi:hypothetical protein